MMTVMGTPDFILKSSGQKKNQEKERSPSVALLCAGLLRRGMLYELIIILLIIMVIFMCYFSREHIALSYKKWCEHRIRENQQIKSTAHDGKSYLK